MAKIKKIKLSGVTYDIEDASAIHSETKLSTEASGSGNAVTGITVSDHKITVTKGETFAKKSEVDTKQDKFTDGSAKVAEATQISGEATGNKIITFYGVSQSGGAIGNGASVAQAYNTTKVEAIHTELSTRIDNLESRGRYLSGWNCTTGKPDTDPTSLPYAYKAGDYYIVSTVGSTNYKPSGEQYSGTASTVVESNAVQVGDVYTYDGAGKNWNLTHTPVVQDTNQKVKSDDNVEFGPNDVVKFVKGDNVTSIAGDATAKTITINVKDTIATASVTGSGNAVTSISADASGKITATKGATFLTSHQDISGKQDKLAVTGSANKPVYVSAAGVVSACSFTVDKSVPSDAKFTDTITTVNATPSGSGNVVTGITADAAGKLTLTKGITALVAADISNKMDKTGDMVADDNDHQFAVAYQSADETKAVGVIIRKESNTQTVNLANVVDGVENGVSVVTGSDVAKVELLAGGNILELTASDATLSVMGTGSDSIVVKDYVDTNFAPVGKGISSIANAASHTHSLSGTISGSGTVDIPTVTPTTKKLVTTSIIPAVSTSITPAVANGSATMTVFGTDTTASKATAGTAKTFVTGVNQASLTGTTTFVTSAVKSAAIDVKTASTTGYQAYVAAYTQPSFSGAGTYVKSITAPTLGGTTTFNTDAYKASYNSADECLELVAASTSTVTISGGTADQTGTISYSTGTVTTKYIGVATTDCGASEKGTVGISGGSASGTDSITPYTFADVTVPVVTSNNAVEVAKAGSSVSVAKAGDAVTVATGALAVNGSGSSLVESISTGTSSQSISVSAALSGNTGSAGEHTHTINR